MDIVRIGVGSSEIAPAEEIGAKAAILARIASAGVPVPPAFVLPIGLGAAIVEGDHEAKHLLKDGLQEGIAFLEEATGRSFGDHRIGCWCRSARARRGRCPACSTVCSMSAAPQPRRGV